MHIERARERSLYSKKKSVKGKKKVQVSGYVARHTKKVKKEQKKIHKEVSE